MKQNKSFIMGLGSICVSLGTILGFGCYQLQDLEKRKKTGSKITKKDKTTGPKLTIYFLNEDAVTKEIKNLQAIRREMRKKKEELNKSFKVECGDI